MVGRRPTRREALMLAAGIGLFPSHAFAEDFTDLDWEDLMPAGQGFEPSAALSGLFDHDTSALAAGQPQSTGVRTDWNGMIVRLPGFILPIEHVGSKVSVFILVPYVGACIHVPPPPANQLVFVTTPTPYDSQGLYEPVNVTGMFGTASTHTQLAEIGYALSADHIEPFG